uniref:7TM_GPCR_Srx domain-containing protein n=1 Tax=Steinernema glaseri TaxID=37863 RepID=A0A1I7YBC1_9BILA
MVAFVYEVPVILNSKAIMWTFDAFIIFPPDVLPIDHTVFISYMNDYNNRILLGSMILSYLALIVALAVKGKGISQTKTQAQVFTVAALICGLNFCPGFIFFLLETIPFMEIMLYVCLFMWQMGNDRNKRRRTHLNLLQQVNSLGSEKFISKAARYTSKQRQQHCASSAVKRKNRSE